VPLQKKIQMSEDLLALFCGRAAKFCEGGRKLPLQITVVAALPAALSRLTRAPLQKLP
jgi:hypothetical protein